MVHKKKEHLENVSICWNFADGSCPFGDESCWFKHVTEPNENHSESGHKFLKCKIRGKMTNSKNDFMRHRKKEQTYKCVISLKKRNCTALFTQISK